MDIAFDGSNRVPYLIGAPTSAVPGTIAGLAEAHRLYGRMPWRELVAPAADVARGGVEISAPQAHFHDILDPVLRASARSRELFGSGARLRAGDRIVMRDLGDTLDQLAEEGAEPFYRGDQARRMVDAVRGRGRVAHLGRPGHVPGRTPKSGARRVPRARVRREPAAVVGRDPDRVRPPDPRPARAAADDQGSPRQIARLAEVMREAARAREGTFGRDLHRGGLAGADPRRPRDRRGGRPCRGRVARRRRRARRAPLHDPRERRGRGRERRVALGLDGDGLRASSSREPGST